MPLSTPTDIPSLIYHVYNVCRKHGVKQVISKWKQFEKEDYEHSQLLMVNKTIELVLKEFSISRSALFNKQNRGACSEGRKMCYVLLKKYASMDETQIAWYFSRHAKVVYRANDEFIRMTTKVKWQKEWMDHYKNVNEELHAYSQELKNKAEKNKA